MKYKTPTPSRTLTRARLDAAIYALYLKLHDGKPRAIAAYKFIAQYKICPKILRDLKDLGIIVFASGRGAKHVWVGAPPTPDLIDRLEQLRNFRSSQISDRLRHKREKKAAAQEFQAQRAAEVLQLQPATLPHPSDLTTDQLLDARNLIDKLLAQKHQTRLPL